MIVDSSTHQRQFASVKEMAAMLHLSVSRYRQLMRAGVMHWPIYDLHSKRPFFNADMIEQNLDCKRRNCGLNGQPVLFYTARASSAPTSSPRKRKTKQPKPKNKSKHADMIDRLQAMGVEATAEQIETILKDAFPADAGASADDDAKLRAVFQRLRRSIDLQNSAHKP